MAGRPGYRLALREVRNPPADDEVPGADVTLIPNPVAEPLARTVAAAPDLVAVRDGSSTLTYSELADAVARTAGAVAAATVDRPDLVVPVVVGRDVDATVGMLGVQQAGRAVAPVDAAAAPAVLADLWRRAGEPPVVVAADPAVADALPGVTLVTPGVGDPRASGAVRTDALAVVLFTSGSTGVPKGVMYDWALVAGAVTRWNDPVLAGPPGAAAGLLFPFHFWGGYQRLLGLVAGRPLVVVDPTRLDAEAVLERLDHDEVEVVGLVPTMIPVLAAAARASGRRLDRVRLVTLGGEALSWHHVSLVRSFVAADAHLSNGYGGTESPLGSLRLEIPPERPVGTGPVPIGVPVAPDRVRFEPVNGEPGAPHEIVVTGPVALGYLGDPDLTARSFPTLPDGTRGWRTGDIAETGAAGEVFLVGRGDDLVKISGTLVAPTRTQTALLALPGVREAAVLAQPVGGRPRLVAHVVVDDDTDPGSLRSTLRTILPAHQLPAHFVRHERLPLTVTNKTDRTALLAGPLDAWRGAPAVPPRTATELTILTRTTAILGTPIGVTDDVWEYGLDSLGAVELAAALRDDGLDVAVDDLVEHPTVAALAERLERADPASPEVRLNPTGTRPPVWCVPGAGGTSIVYRSLANALGADQPLVVVEPRGYRTPGRPRLRVRAIARDVTARITAAGPPGPVVVVGYSSGVVVAHTVCHQLVAHGWRPRLVGIDGGPVGEPSRPPTAGPTARLRHTASLTRKNLRAAIGWITARTHSERIDNDGNFVAYARWAVRRHRPAPTTFPTRLVRPGPGDGGTWPTPPDRTVDAGGDHITILHPPHVTAVAAAIGEELDALSP